MNKDEKLYDYLYITEESSIEFRVIEPDKYFIRIIEDAYGNKNETPDVIWKNANPKT